MIIYEDIINKIDEILIIFNTILKDKQKINTYYKKQYYDLKEKYDNLKDEYETICDAYRVSLVRQYQSNNNIYNCWDLLDPNTLHNK